MAELLSTNVRSLRQFKPYPKYKDSGVEWLGTMPSHWSAMRMKWLGWFKGGSGFPDGEQGLVGEEIAFLKVSDMNLLGNEFVTHNTTNTVSRNTAKRLGATIFDKGVIIFPKVGAALLTNKRRVLGRPSCIDNNLMAFTVEKSNVGYMYYQLLCLDFARLANPGAVPSMNEGQVRDIAVTVPPTKEQRTISEFLGRETGRIDALIEKKEKLIELLQEKRSALITQAVTKGLDPNAPMKDSGAEWLDCFPSHWLGLPLKRWVERKITDGPHETPPLQTEGVQFISAEAISNGRIDFEKKRGLISDELHKQYSRKCKPVRNDILLCKSGATTGKLAMVDVDFEFSVWSPLALIRADQSRMLPQFLTLALEADSVQENIRRTWSAGTQPNISMGDIERLFVVAPGLEEQRKIVDEITRGTDHFDALVAKVREGTERLREFRTALISAAVTGKIDVRGEAA